MLWHCERVGEGAKARAGYEQAAPILVAIESFRTSTGEYPDSLGALVPGLLEQGQLTLRAARAGNYPFEYERLTEGYSLTFRYTGPGMNACTFSRSAMSWSCTGYF